MEYAEFLKKKDIVDHATGFRQYAQPKGAVGGEMTEKQWMEEVDKAPEIPTEKMPPSPPEKIGYAPIVLRIDTDRDRILFEAIGESAKKYRRTPEQQIMYILEQLFAGEDKGDSA